VSVKMYILRIMDIHVTMSKWGSVSPWDPEQFKSELRRAEDSGSIIFSRQ